MPIGLVWTLLVVAGLPSDLGLTLEVDPVRAVAGETQAVSLHASIGDSAIDDIRFVVETGSVGDLVSASPGTLHARWDLPNELSPRRFAAAVVDTRRWRVAFVTLAVHRRARVKIQTEPGVQVRAMIGQEVVADGRAGRRGTAQLSVLVPPGIAPRVGAAQIERTRDGVVETRQLLNADQLRVWGVARARTLKGEATVAAAYLHPYWDSGAEPEEFRVMLHLEGGAQIAVAELEHRIFSGNAVIEPKRVGRVSLEATASSLGKTTSLSLLVPIEPVTGHVESVRLVAPSSPLAVGQLGTLTVEVMDREGSGVPGLEIEPTFDVASASATHVTPATDLGNGRYQFSVLAPESPGPVSVSVRVLPDGTVSNQVSIPVRPQPASRAEIIVPEVAQGPTPVSVRVTDLYGNPTVAPRVTLTASTGVLDAHETTAGHSLDTVWRPKDARRPETVDLSGSVVGTDIVAKRRFEYVPSVQRWSAGVYAGLASFDARAESTVGLNLDYDLRVATRTSLVVDSSVARIRRLYPAGPRLPDARIEQVVWMVPLSFGVQRRWFPTPRWTLFTGVGAGALLSLSSARVLPAGEPAGPKARLLGASIMLRAYGGIGYEVGPGEGQLRVGVWDALTASPGWVEPPWGLKVAAAYTWSFGG